MWVLQVQEFNYEVEHRPGEHLITAIVTALSRVYEVGQNVDKFVHKSCDLPTVEVLEL